MLPVAILAGGLGSRLGPITNERPKALIDIDGVPFCARQLHLLKDAGIHRAVMCVGHLHHQIRECIGDGSRLGIDVEYSCDGPTLLGTAGAVINALPLLGDRFFVLYGDSYLPCNYQAVERAFLERDSPGLMTVFRNQNRWQRSNVEFRDDRVVAYNKSAPTTRMEYIDYGLSVFHSHVFSASDLESTGDLTGFFQDLVEREQLAGFEISERFYEVGSWEGIQALQGYVRRSTSQQLLV